MLAADAEIARPAAATWLHPTLTAAADEGAMQRPRAATARMDPVVGSQIRAAAAAAPRDRRPPGLLALFPDTVAHYPRDGSLVWRCAVGRPRRKCQLPPAPAPETVSWRSVVADQAVVLVLFLDPRQPHSLRVRNALLDPCAVHELPCLVVALEDSKQDDGGTDEEARGDRHSSCHPDDPLAACLRGTGFCHAPPSALLRTALNVTQVPSLVVLHEGRRVSGDYEELALEWAHAPDDAVAAWRAGQSALSGPQRLRAALAFPLCTVL